MLGLAHLRFGDSIFFHIGFGVGLTKAVEVAPSEFCELPAILSILGKTCGLMTLRVSADINVKTLIFRHG